LEEAGWRSGRAVDTAQWEVELAVDSFRPLHSVAREFLVEFGGLAVQQGGPGVTRVREPFTLAPIECSGEADRFIEWGEHIGRDIAPIGELAGGTCGWALLGIDEQEEVYLVIDRLATFGRLPAAMDHLVLGYMPCEISKHCALIGDLA
jgi:SUKH-3 immunity protein